MNELIKLIHHQVCEAQCDKTSVSNSLCIPKKKQKKQKIWSNYETPNATQFGLYVSSKLLWVSDALKDMYMVM